MTVDATPCRQATALVAVEVVHTRAAIQTRTRHAEVSLLAENARILGICAATDELSRNAFTKREPH